jgi:hypothetical protein
LGKAATLCAGAVIHAPGPTPRSRAEALLAFDEWERHQPDRVPWSVRAVFADVVRHAFESSPLRVERGIVEAWYSQLTKRVGRTARNAAMRRLRAAGLIDGRPNDPDPDDKFYRAPARWRVAIPAVCRQTLNRVRYAAKKLIAPGRNEGRTPDPQSGFVSYLESHGANPTRVNQDDGPPLAVDYDPTRPIPATYWTDKGAAWPNR